MLVKLTREPLCRSRTGGQSCNILCALPLRRAPISTSNCHLGVWMICRIDCWRRPGYSRPCREFQQPGTAVLGLDEKNVMLEGAFRAVHNCGGRPNRRFGKYNPLILLSVAALACAEVVLIGKV